MEEKKMDKMTTNKRFECDKGSRIIIDNETKLHYIMTLDWECRLITKVLNNLSEENMELKQKIISLDDARYSYKQDWKQASIDCDVYKDEINSLKDENKGLIEEKERLQNTIDNLVNMTARVQYRADLIKEENEQLNLNYNELRYANDIYCKKIDSLKKENEQLKKGLKRCKDWINSDKNDYELTLAFIKNKGYSLNDILEYEKELKSE